MEELERIQEFMDEHTNLCKWRQWRALGLYARLYIFLWVGKLSLWKLREVLCMRPQTSIQMSTCERLYKQTTLLKRLCTVRDVPIILRRYIFLSSFLFGQFWDNRRYSCAPPACQAVRVRLVLNTFSVLTLTVFREISVAVRNILFDSISVIHFHYNNILHFIIHLQ